ncbi:diacylglycerol/lipid kinase family protein [Formosa algae]|uniref:diacylglycerol/lipid kinase family protein n=1 Tax=Formosa algae TaxID=225843 RepID=UPI000CD1B7D0|nr:acylglycerol kinase family protein [Formosa algae]
MKQIHFIINPIAGSGEKRLSINILRKFFELEAYNIELKYSSFKGHAIDLTKESINQEADVIVACGGDGTINEVASVLVGTGIPLGILPIGSGNGLASHLKIPKKFSASNSGS